MTVIATARAPITTSDTSWERPLEEEILHILFRYRNVTPRLPAKDNGFEFHLEKVRAAVQRNAPIQIVLPAFPAKSPNPEKTSGSLPDYAEVLALQRLNSLCQQIGRVYSPGAELIICSDGRVFSDLVEVDDRRVDLYSQGITEIIRRYSLNHLTTFNLEDVFTQSAGYGEMRAQLVDKFSRSVDAIRKLVVNDADHRNLFNGIHRFLFEDQRVLYPTDSKTKVRNRAKELTYRVIQRSNAWSDLVEKTFPAALRFSIHPQPEHSKKIGVQLLASDDIWRTPWHSVALFDGKNFRLVPRAEARRLNAVEVKADGKYPYFQLPSGENLHAFDRD